MPDDAAVSANSPGGSVMSGNLKLRILSGVAFAAVALLLTYFGLLTFALLVLVCSMVICWEWGRLVRGVGFDIGFWVHAVSVAAAIVLAAAGHAALSLAVLIVAAITMVPLYMGSGARLSALGVFYVGLPAVTLLWIRGDEPFGFLAVLLLFGIVWLSDIGAYAAGRLIGGPKLWPRVSPNKTWAGLGGALAGGLLAGLIIGVLDPHLELGRLLALAFFLALVAQAGDLAESALKRSFGLKDASDLIPGHGGFMDRMDSLVAVAVVVALLALAIDASDPARALLYGF
jgi:phosphatidate cytidylyltransferase